VLGHTEERYIFTRYYSGPLTSLSANCVTLFSVILFFMLFYV